MAELTAADLRAFTALEHTGWENAPPMYDPFVGALTQQAVERLFDATHVEAGTRLLDVACGPGYAAAEASARGATMVGTDFASAMVAEAHRRFPHADFRQGDAHALPFAEASFDAVICSFGLLHFAEPDKALAEAYRVLGTGRALWFHSQGRLVPGPRCPRWVNAPLQSRLGCKRSNWPAC